MPRTLATALLAALLAAAGPGSAGCAARAAQARTRAFLGALDGATIPRPLPEAWPEVGKLLSARGYALAGADAEAVGQEETLLLRITSRARVTQKEPGGGLSLETAFGPGAARYRAEGRPVAGGCRITLTRIPEDYTEHNHDGSGSRRDGDLELALLRILAPEEAARVAAADPR